MTVSINKPLNSINITTNVTPSTGSGVNKTTLTAIVKAVNGCTQIPLSPQAVDAMISTASSAKPTKSEIVKGGGLQRALLRTPETTYALMTRTRNKMKRDKKLGEGSFKTAKLAVDLETGKKYVVAVCWRSRCSPAQWKDLEGEVAAMEALRGKEGIVQLYAHCKYMDPKRGEKMYLLMEYCDRGELFDTLANPLHPIHRDFKQQLQIALDCAGGVKVMHDNNLLHRDLKPENIFAFTGTDGKLHAKVGDLGFACRADDRDQLKSRCGTILWFPPERAILVTRASMGKPVAEDEWIAATTPKTDIWALGGIFHAIFSPTSSMVSCQSGANDFALSLSIGTADQTQLTHDIRGSGMDFSAVPLVEEMLSVRADQRPNITEVCDYLEGLARDEGLIP